MIVQMGWDVTFWSSSHLEEIVSLFTWGSLLPGAGCKEELKNSNERKGSF